MKSNGSQYNFDENFDWQLQFLDPIRGIVGPLLLKPAPLEIDLNEAGDMVLSTPDRFRLACRVRRPWYHQAFRFEFTIRSKVSSGAKTELQKIMDGEADWMFYGHATQSARPDFSIWHVINLSVLRQHWVTWGFHPREKHNGDGTEFVVFDIRPFWPAPILIASNQPQEPQQQIPLFV